MYNKIKIYYLFSYFFFIISINSFSGKTNVEDDDTNIR